MADEGEQIPVEQESNTGKWILLIVAIVFVAATVYGYVTTTQHVDKITKDLGDSQAQVAELKNRMQTAEASEETLAHQLGMTKKELAQRATELQRQQKASESRLEEEQKQQISQVNGVIHHRASPSQLLVGKPSPMTVGNLAVVHPIDSQDLTKLSILEHLANGLSRSSKPHRKSGHEAHSI